MKQKIKLGIILGVEFIAITTILLLIFFAGKKSYKVTFDLNGGTLISGDVEQVVMQGKSATPPVAAKEGCYLHSWSASFKQITRDIVIKAVWEWHTSIGFNYTSSEDSDYCEIESSFKNLTGDVYVGVYHNDKKILGVQDGAFKDRDGITYIHMLDGIISIGDEAFSECDSLVSVELPKTLTKLGKNAFKNCTSLEKIVLPDTLKVIEAGTFLGCTSLEEIIIPSTVEVIEEDAFLGCTSLKTVTFAEKKLAVTDPEEEDEDENEEAVEIEKRAPLTIKENAFSGCESLVEVTLPEEIAFIGSLAFDNELLTINMPIAEDEVPEDWADDWYGSSTVVWKYVAPTPEEDQEQEPEKERSWF